MDNFVKTEQLKFKDKRLVIFFAVLVVFLILYWLKSLTPVFSYKLKEFEIDENISEKPLEILSYDKNSINFGITFGGAAGEYSNAVLKLEKKIKNYPPFFEYGNTLIVVVSNPRYKLTEDRAVFSLNGTMTNLDSGDYKLRIEDSNKNLIDEKTFTMLDNGLAVNPDLIKESSTQTIGGTDGDGKTSGTSPYDSVGDVRDDIDPSKYFNDSQNNDPSKFCKIDTDCVPVGCGCSCSGCGGFDYDDIVNEKYEDVWYYQHSCNKEKICPQVCCDPIEVKCLNNVCAALPVETGN